MIQGFRGLFGCNMRDMEIWLRLCEGWFMAKPFMNKEVLVLDEGLLLEPIDVISGKRNKRERVSN